VRYQSVDGFSDSQPVDVEPIGETSLKRNIITGTVIGTVDQLFEEALTFQINGSLEVFSIMENHTTTLVSWTLIVPEFIRRSSAADAAALVSSMESLLRMSFEALWPILGLAVRSVGCMGLLWLHPWWI